MEDDGRLEIHNWGTSDQSMKDHPAVKLMSVIAERDAAILERNTALAEKKAAYAERDVALLQRDVAIADRNSALLERDAAVAALEYTKDINLNGQKSPSCGTVAGTKLFHVLAENSSLGPKEYRSIQQVSAAFPASVSEAPPAEQSKQTMRPYTANEGQKESPSNKTSDGSEPLTPKPKKPRKQDATTGEESYRQLAIVKHEWKDQDYANNKIAFDPSTMPIPVCSCTGVPQQCYRWGSGGWQSACCTTSISMYPLPMNPNKQGSRVGGRKMSGSAFGKLLGRLVAEGHDLACPIDLKNHWAKHGTNRYITIRSI
eukprot:Gb_16500 [translate_table: standard]